MADELNLLLADSTRRQTSSDEAYDQQLRHFVSQLRHAFSLKGGKRIEDTELLNVLHPATNTIGYIFLLLFITIDRTTPRYLISLAAFLTHFDVVQARYAGREWRRIVEITEELISTTQNSDLLTPLRTAILRIDPSGSTLTNNHLSYIRCCLQLKRPREALPLLDQDLLSFPYDEISGVDDRLLCDTSHGQDYITIASGISGDMTVLTVQEYYLLGAQVYIGQRNFDRASLFLEFVLSTPSYSFAVSALMVEAYKKLILVNLVSHGQAPQVSQIVETAISRTLSQSSKPYEILAEAFRARNLAKFHAEVDAAGSCWQDDGNLGLVREAGEALRRYRVVDLQKTYTSLPIERVAKHLSMPVPETTALLQSMTQQGHLNASISSSSSSSSSSSTQANGATNGTQTPVIRFGAWDPTKSSLQANSDEHIRAQVARIEFLSKAIKESDRRYSLTKEYVDWLRRNKKGADAGAAAYEDPMEMDHYDGGSGDGGEDEDIMAT